jgi:hypothetical protein
MFFFFRKILLVTGEKIYENCHSTHANRYAVLLLSLWKLHDKLRARLLLGIIERTKTANDFD